MTKATDDSFDVYEDLDVFTEQSSKQTKEKDAEFIKLREENKTLYEENCVLKSENLALKCKVCQIEEMRKVVDMNFKAFSAIAFRDSERKERLVAEERRQKDELLFRRKRGKVEKGVQVKPEMRNEGVQVKNESDKRETARVQDPSVTSLAAKKGSSVKDRLGQKRPRTPPPTRERENDHKRQRQRRSRSKDKEKDRNPHHRSSNSRRNKSKERKKSPPRKRSLTPPPPPIKERHFTFKPPSVSKTQEESPEETTKVVKKPLQQLWEEAQINDSQDDSFIELPLKIQRKQSDLEEGELSDSICDPPPNRSLSPIEKVEKIIRDELKSVQEENAHHKSEDKILIQESDVVITPQEKVEVEPEMKEIINEIIEKQEEIEISGQSLEKSSEMIETEKEPKKSVEETLNIEKTLEKVESKPPNPPQDSSETIMNENNELNPKLARKRCSVTPQKPKVDQVEQRLSHEFEECTTEKTPEKSPIKSFSTPQLEELLAPTPIKKSDKPEDSKKDADGQNNITSMTTPTTTAQRNPTCEPKQLIGQLNESAVNKNDSPETNNNSSSPLNTSASKRTIVLKNKVYEVEETEEEIIFTSFKKKKKKKKDKK